MPALITLISNFDWTIKHLVLCGIKDRVPLLRRFVVHWKNNHLNKHIVHHNDVIMGAIASQITSLTIVYSIVYSDADQRKHQSSASLAFVRGIHRGPVNSPHKWSVTRKMFPFDDVNMIMWYKTQSPIIVKICSYRNKIYIIKLLDYIQTYLRQSHDRTNHFPRLNKRLS